ncbi:MAG: trypsin-like peptidase domain-containing protein [Bacteriovoracaceae bacterium]|nr:trypsin-like peptidase domain-containing protein [Bacteriovoracaceae bacterium]
MKTKKMVAVFVLLSSICVARVSHKSIYGDDNREEARNYHDHSIADMASSVAAMVHVNDLTDLGGNLFDFGKTTLGEAVNLCPGEIYADQYSLAACSGFLISSDILVTAGHCVLNMNDCNNYKWVFDYYDDSETFDGNNIYSCKKIIDQKYKESSWSVKDYAIIKLDRPVSKRSPLKFRKSGRLSKKDNLAIIGHPAGLPMKIAGDAKKQKWSKDEKSSFIKSLFKKYYYFRADLDSFAGNSGSPVINTDNGMVEGILVSGARDFITTYNYGDPCRTHARYQNHDSEAEETVFKITRIKILKKL